MEDRTLTLTTEDGKEIVCDILFTHQSKRFGKDYVIFLPRGAHEASAASYIEKGNGAGELLKIEIEEEWQMLEDLLNDYYNNIEEDAGCGGNCSSCSSCGGDCDGEYDGN